MVDSQGGVMAEILDFETLFNRADEAYRSGNYLEAAGYYEAAKIGYQTSGNNIKYAEMANNCSVALLRGKDAAGALSVLEGIQEIFEGRGDQRGYAITHGNRAAALDALGRKEEAATEYHCAAEIFERIGEKELYMTTMKALSAVQLRSGRSLEAVATMQAGIDRLEKPGIKMRFLKWVLDIPKRLLSR